MRNYIVILHEPYKVIGPTTKEVAKALVLKIQSELFLRCEYKKLIDLTKFTLEMFKK